MTGPLKNHSRTILIILGEPSVIFLNMSLMIILHPAIITMTILLQIIVVIIVRIVIIIVIVIIRLRIRLENPS